MTRGRSAGFRVAPENLQQEPEQRIGVNAVESIIDDLGWIFREQPIVDLGRPIRNRPVKKGCKN